MLLASYFTYFECLIYKEVRFIIMLIFETHSDDTDSGMHIETVNDIKKCKAENYRVPFIEKGHVNWYTSFLIVDQINYKKIQLVSLPIFDLCLRSGRKPILIKESLPLWNI